MFELTIKLRRLRDFHEYSQAAVAYYLDIAQTTYSDMETGVTRISLERLNQIAMLYKLPLSDLINKSAPELIKQILDSEHISHKAGESRNLL